ncbi:DMT family transporter [Ruminiclostridium herbifermentans]|uniref:DMT family transporter n=1 Tax=Ruminiclostridium herbifermentans TaxID=2488810 RepID=A0A4V6EPU2_9FIRM|nr:DMT family transporter [Ruminiclostridium herbifermentans]QNU65948.1 DMT family transporter [Ruminiclostridium herbifermentans]
MKIITKANAQFFLLLNALFWGSSYIWSKMLLNILPPFFILFICSILGLLITVVLFKKHLTDFNKRNITVCILISLVSVASNTFCMLALTRTSSANTAFIVQLSIIITPIIMSILDRKAPTPKIIISALLAMGGIYLITCYGKGLQINLGDIFALCNAVCFSLYIALQNKFLNEVNPVQFTFFQHATNFIAFLVLSLMFEKSSIAFGNILNPLFFVLIGLNAVVIIFTSLFQSSAIKYIRPENATILYSFEPVTTAILGAAILGEKFTGIHAVVGCFIILFAAIISSLKPRHLFKKRMYKLLFQINTKI